MNKKKAMTPRELAEKMRELDRSDSEGAHIAADDLMCVLLESLGYGEAMKIYRAMNKWYA